MKSRVINKVFASPLHFFFFSFPGSLMVFFHSVAGRPYSRDWFTSLDTEKEEKRDRSGACGRELRESGVIGLGSGAELPPAHSVLWA